jgi:hypothetical protein
MYTCNNESIHPSVFDGSSVEYKIMELVSLSSSPQQGSALASTASLAQMFVAQYIFDSICRK